MQTAVFSRNSREAFATRAATYFVLYMLTVVSGCSSSGKSAEVAEYRFQWRDGIDVPWTAYSVSSSEDRRLVGEWIASHSKELAICDEHRNGAYIPLNALAEVYANGKHRTHVLMSEYPIDPEKPVALRSYATNLNREDFDTLRALFVEHGVPVEPNANPQDGDE